MSRARLKRNEPRLTGQRVELLATSAVDCELTAIDEAIGCVDFDDAAARVLARALRGEPVPIASSAAVFPHVVSGVAIALMGIGVGDRLRAFWSLLEHDNFPETEEGAFVRALTLLAAWKLDRGELRTCLLGHARVLAIVHQSDRSLARAASVLRAFAEEARDPVLLDVVAESPAGRLDVEVLALEHVARGIDARVIARGTVEGLDRAGPQASPISDVRWARLSLEPGDLTMDEARVMALHELAALPLQALGVDALIAMFERFLLCSLWERAEHALNELAHRHAVPAPNRDVLRLTLMERAIVGRRPDVAARHADAITTPEIAALVPTLTACAAVQSRSADALDRLIAVTDRAFADDSGRLAINLATGLGHAAPSLAALIARGALYGDRSWESERLLGVVEASRGRLGLSPGDRAWDVYASLRSNCGEVTAELSRELGDALRDAGDHARQMETRVRELEAEVERRELARGAAATAEVRELRARVADLKAMIQERNAERAELRKRLADAEVRAQGRAERTTPDREREDDEGDDVDAPDRRIRVPTWQRRAADALRIVPAHVAREALRTVADLASADAASWRAVKRPKGMGWSVLMTRIGIHYRLIFHVEGGGLDVLDLVTRESLDAALKRLRD